MGLNTAISGMPDDIPCAAQISLSIPQTIPCPLTVRPIPSGFAGGCNPYGHPCCNQLLPFTYQCKHSLALHPPAHALLFCALILRIGQLPQFSLIVHFIGFPVCSSTNGTNDTGILLSSPFPSCYVLRTGTLKKELCKDLSMGHTCSMLLSQHRRLGEVDLRSAHTQMGRMLSESPAVRIAKLRMWYCVKSS